jgi:hypothetical protein
MRIRLKAPVVPEYPSLRVCFLFPFHLHNFLLVRLHYVR